jgi:hypothetical protein
VAITNGYLTLTELKTQLSIADTVDDTSLEQAIEAASREIDRYCGRRFYYDADVSARSYTASNPFRLYVDDFGTTTGLVLKTDDNDDGTFETTWSASDYQVEPLNGRVESQAWAYFKLTILNGALPLGRRARVQVTARWGWATTPTDVKEACYLLASDLFKAKDAPFGVAGFGDMGLIRIRSNPRAADLLDVYRHVRGF